MKKLVILFVSMAVAVQAADEFRVFTANDGRTLKAKVLAYNLFSGEVKILRDDNRAISVNCSAFSLEDQEYIRQWTPCSLFMIPSKFVIIPRCASTKTWRQKHVVTNTGGPQSGGGQGGSSGGNSGGGPGGGQGGEGPDDGGSEVVATDKNSTFNYVLSFDNRSGIPLENLSAEYCIYYEQDKPVAEQGAQVQQQQQRRGPENSQDQGTYRAESEVKQQRGVLAIERFDNGDRRNVSTDSVTILERNAASDGQGAMIDLDGKLLGIWVKVTMEAPDGSLVTRDVVHPRHLRKKVMWEPIPEHRTAETGREPPPHLGNG